MFMMFMWSYGPLRQRGRDRARERESEREIKGGREGGKEVMQLLFASRCRLFFTHRFRISRRKERGDIREWCVGFGLSLDLPGLPGKSYLELPM